MLGRVLAASRHYLEHPVAALTCRNSRRTITASRGRRSVSAFTVSQRGAIRNASRHEDERRVENDTKSKSILPPRSTTTVNASSKDLARAFIDFLGRHGQTTDSALRCLSSGEAAFTPILQILDTPSSVRRVAKELAASDEPAPCIRLLSLALAYGYPLNAPTYEGICWTLSLHEQYLLILEVFRLAKENLETLTCRLLDWRLCALLELGNYTAFRNALRDYEETQVRLSRRAWYLILTAEIRNRNVAACRQCLSAMEAAGLPINSTTHATIAENYHHLGLDRQVRDITLSILRILPPSRRVFVVNTLLESHIMSNDHAGLHELFSFFDPDIFGPVQRILNLLDNLNPNAGSTIPPVSLHPNTQTFLIAIRLCLMRSDFEGAERIFSLMEQQNIKLSPTILAAYMNLQLAARKPNIAIHLMSQVLSDENFNALCDRLDQRNNILPDWKWPFSTSRIPPHVDVMNALLRGILSSHGLDGALIVLEQMQQVDVKPNTYSLKILIDYLVRFKPTTPTDMLHVLRQLFPTFRASLHHLHPLISHILRHEKRRLHYTSTRKRADKRVPQNVDWSSDGPLAGVQLDQMLVRPSLARFLVASLESRGIRSDAAMLALRIRYDGIIKQDPEGAVDTYRDMLSRGIVPSVYHVSALMEGFALQGETDTSLKIMRSARMHSVKPNVVMYTILLHGYGRQNQAEVAAQLFEAMIESGIYPDVRAIYALCHAFILARRLVTAKQLLITLWHYVAPMPQQYPDIALLVLLKKFCQLDTSRPTTPRNLSERKEGLIRRQLSLLVKALKRSSGLPKELISSSPQVRRLIKRSRYVNRKV